MSLTKWQERAFPFLRKYEELCQEYRIIVRNDQLIDVGKYEEDPHWYIYFETLSRYAENDLRSLHRKVRIK